MHEPGFIATIGSDPPLPASPTALSATAVHERVAAPTLEVPEAPVPVRPHRRPRSWPRPRRGRHRRAMSGILLAGIVAVIALFATGMGHELFGSLRKGGAVRTVPAEGGSLLRAAGLEAALQGLPRGRVQSLRVSAGHLDAEVVVAGELHRVRVTDRGWVTDVPTPERPSGARVRVDARAPARLVRTATQRANRRVESVDHVRLDGSRWQLVFKDGAQFSADRSGRDVRRG
jgi:hypothetical protein